MKTIGIIGGLGPMATVYYLELITRMTDVDSDQKHPRIYMQSVPDIPDRTAYILGETTENPLDLMVQAGKSLAAMGADFLTIPCVTAHYFYPELQKQVGIPVINLLEETANTLESMGVNKVGILATSGTNRSKVLEEKITEKGISVVLPDEKRQDMIMDIIYNQVKGGRRVHWEQFHEVALWMQNHGAQKLILGCTELPLLRRDSLQAENPFVRQMLKEDCVDVLEVLAKAAVKRSGVPYKPFGSLG